MVRHDLTSYYQSNKGEQNEFCTTVTMRLRTTLGLLLLAACAPDGAGLSPTGPDDTAHTPAPGAVEGVDPACVDRAPRHSVVRRLTRFEYNNTVRDLLGDTTQPAKALPSEEIGNGFGNDSEAQAVSSLLAEQRRRWSTRPTTTR